MSYSSQQYMNLVALYGETWNFESSPDNYEGRAALYSTWSTILAWQFPQNQRYYIQPRYPGALRFQHRDPSFSELHVLRHDPTLSVPPRKCLVVIFNRGPPRKRLLCKRRRPQIPRDEWERRLSETFRQSGPYRTATNRKTFGIVAIGEYLKVYQYHTVSGEVSNPDWPGYDPETPLHLTKDAESIQKILNWIAAYENPGNDH